MRSFVRASVPGDAFDAEIFFAGMFEPRRTPGVGRLLANLLNQPFWFLASHKDLLRNKCVPLLHQIASAMI
jgi:hypothetical protein